MADSIRPALFLSVFLFFPLSLYAFDYYEILNELTMDDWQVRLLNERTINMFRDKSNFDNLIAVVNDRGIDWRIRVRGIKIVGETRIPEAGIRLVDMFDDGSFHFGCPSIKFHIVSAIGNYANDSRAILTLIEGLSDIDVLVREESAKSLGRIGDPSTVPYLAMALSDRSLAVKMRAIKSLAEIGDPAAYPYLKYVMDNENEDPLIRKAASTAVDMLRERNN